jgi:hypothetical protein
MADRSKIDRHSYPCPDCGVALKATFTEVADDYPENSPLREATPFLRLCALAASVNVGVFNMAEAQSFGLAGVLGLGTVQDGQRHAAIGLADGIDEDLRTDVLAFGLAVFAADADVIMSRADGCLGISQERLEPAKKGVGHLAWHMLNTCGRDSPSATFDVVPMP